MIAGGRRDTGVDTGDDTGFTDFFSTQVGVFPPRANGDAGEKITPACSRIGRGQRWLVMLYQDADDKILEQDIYVDLNDRTVGSSDRVQIVAQIDASARVYGDGNWTDARRCYHPRIMI